VHNLFVHPRTDDIWFGASPVVYKLLDYFKNPTEIASPSQVNANNNVAIYGVNFCISTRNYICSQFSVYLSPIHTADFDSCVASASAVFIGQ